MKRSGNLLIVAIMAAAIITIVGCAAKKHVAIYEDPDLAQIEIKNMTLFPVVDRRVDKSHEMDLEKSIGDKVEKKLKSKGYTVVRPGGFSDTLNFSNEAVAEMEPREIALLGTEGDSFLFIVYLDDASSVTALGYSFKVEITGVLIDRTTAAMIWKGKGISSQGQGGLLGCMMSGAVKGDALNKAVEDMLGSLPNTPEKRK